MAVVLLPFPFAGNGFTIEHLNAGDEREFGSATGGLVAAGLISVEAGASAEVASVESEPVADVESADSAVAQKKTQRRR